MITHRRHTGVPAGRQRDWIPVTTLSVPTVWMATAEGIVCLDLIAVELAVNGLRQGTLTSHEAAYAADYMFQHGMQHGLIATRTGVSGDTLRRWFPTETTPLREAFARIRSKAVIAAERLANLPAKAPARCGTYTAAQRHVRRKEPLDEPCRMAKRAADRHYRKHGTYVGCPEFPS
jgi:hypothetical protein